MTPPLPEGVDAGGRFDEWAPGRPRYAVADVDGTLVGATGHIHDVVIDAVERVVDAGIRFGVATGRMRLSVEPLCEQLGTPGPHILHNGAEVRADGRQIAARPLTPGQVTTVRRIAADLEVYAELYLEDGYVVTEWAEPARPHWELLGIQPKGLADVVGPEDVVYKATFGLFDGADEKPLLEALERVGLRAGPASSPLTPQILYVNATHPDADKGKALSAAAAHIGCDLSEVVAIGDARNDLSMLATAGTAIAMGQADEDIRAAAHLVVPGVDAHGVAHALDACRGWLR